MVEMAGKPDRELNKATVEVPNSDCVPHASLNRDPLPAPSPGLSPDLVPTPNEHGATLAVTLTAALACVVESSLAHSPLRSMEASAVLLLGSCNVVRHCAADHL